MPLLLMENRSLWIVRSAVFTSCTLLEMEVHISILNNILYYMPPWIMQLLMSSPRCPMRPPHHVPPKERVIKHARGLDSRGGY